MPATSEISAIGNDSGLNAFLSQYSSDLSDTKAKVAKKSEQMEPIVSDLEDQKKELKGMTPPQLTPIPEAPQATHTDPWKTWGSPAMWIAAVGPLMTRHHATNALNAAASVMQAQRSGDAEATKQNMEIWKAHSDNVIKMNDFALKAYKDVIDRSKDVANIDLGELRANAAAIKDDLMLQTIETQGAHGVVKAVGDMEKQNSKFKESQEKMDIWDSISQTPEYQALPPEQKGQKYNEFWHPKAGGSASGNAPLPTAGLPELEQKALDDDAKAFSEGMPITQLIRGYGKQSTAKLDQIKKRAEELGLNTDRAKSTIEYSGKQSQARGEEGAIGRRAGTTEVGVGEFDQLIEPTRKAIHKLDMGNWKDLNSFVASYDEHLNDPDYIEAFNMIQELQNAYTSVLTRGGQRTDAAQALSEHTISTLFGTKGSDRALDTMAANTKRIMAGIDKAKAGTVGKSDIPPNAPTATGPDGKKVYWNGTAWVHAGGE